MLGRTHFMAGVLIATQFSILQAPVIILGALFPDIDSPHSTIGRHFQWIGKLFGHRTFFHSIIVWFLLGIIAYSITGSFAFMIAYASHLLLDASTKQGLYGLKGPIKTGGFAEKIIFLLMGFVSLFLFVARF